MTRDLLIRAKPESIREADEHEFDDLARMLARAFHDDPLACWACPDDRLRPAALERFHRSYLDVAAQRGSVLVSGDQEAAYLWMPCGDESISMREGLKLAAALTPPRYAWRFPLVTAGLARAEAMQPEGRDYFYLAVMGVEPEAQGQGHGSQLMAHTIELSDEAGLPSYLETGKLENVRLYQRFGFQLTGTIRLPRGPELYLMWREPLGERDPALEQYVFDDYDLSDADDGSPRPGAPRARIPKNPRR